MKICEPQSEAEFQKYYDLRWRILREPLGLPKGSEKDPLEDKSYHLYAQSDDGVMLGVAKFKPSTPTVVQISHIAVEESAQGQGIGRVLVAHLEEEAQRRGCLETFLTAREYNIPYFQKLGYRLGEEEVEGNPLPTIRIFKMHKSL